MRASAAGGFGRLQHGREVHGGKKASSGLARPQLLGSYMRKRGGSKRDHPLALATVPCVGLTPGLRLHPDLPRVGLSLCKAESHMTEGHASLLW